MKKGNKVIQCGCCEKRIILKMTEKTGHARCSCGYEMRIDNDPNGNLIIQMAQLEEKEKKDKKMTIKGENIKEELERRFRKMGLAVLDVDETLYTINIMDIIRCLARMFKKHEMRIPDSDEELTELLVGAIKKMEYFVTVIKGTEYIDWLDTTKGGFSLLKLRP